jgi:hypothetical protein
MDSPDNLSMPRKLKTFVTESGFFELAVAAPSMKEALRDWGIGVNLFQQGLARQTEDPVIVAAAQSVPGKVLSRPIGSKAPFREGAELPEPKGKAANRSKGKTKSKSQARSKSDGREGPAPQPHGAVDLRAIREARATLEEAQQRHRKRTAALDKERDALERRAQWEEDDWQREKERLEEAIDRLKD